MAPSLGGGCGSGVESRIIEKKEKDFGKNVFWFLISRKTIERNGDFVSVLAILLSGLFCLSISQVWEINIVAHEFAFSMFILVVILAAIGLDRLINKMALKKVKVIKIEE